MLKIKEKNFTVVNYKIINLFLCLWCVFAAVPETARAQTIEITYQGKLTDGGMSGLGAADAAAIEPLLVAYNTAGEVDGVKYDRLGVVLLNAVMEQQSQIETQQDEIQTQNSQIERQQKQLRQQQSVIESLPAIVCQTNAQAEVCRQK